MSNFKEINYKTRAISNQLLNETDRNNTVTSTTPNFSVFDKSFQQATSFNSGDLIPILLQECYPGDIYDIDTNALVRLSAPASTPFMNINYDINYFFVPFSQIDPDFKQLMGENNSYGFSNTNLSFPRLDFNDDDFQYTENDLANYFNIPINTSFKNRFEIQIYPFLAYGKVWNEWYRDQNYDNVINITSVFSSLRSIYSARYNNNMDFHESVIFGKGLAKTSKFPSYFTSILPYQQKGVAINVMNFDNVYLRNLQIEYSKIANDTYHPFRVYSGTGSNYTDAQGKYLALGEDDASVVRISKNNAPSGYTVSPTTLRLNLRTTRSISPFDNIQPINVNDLRYSIVSQHLLENWALCGSRYVEQLKSIWGIEIDPKQINRTEIIGGFNDSLIFNNIQQTSQTSANSQLGNIASSLYNSISLPSKISYAASQHGYIIGLVTFRTAINNGGQGLPKIFTYDNYLDLFNPLFNGIGEQPILKQELYFNDKNYDKNKETLGFNEPFLNTKYNIDNANGFFSLRSKQSLFPLFLFGEKYTESPIINAKWMYFDPNIIGNTLYKFEDGNKEFYHQFIALFTFYIKYTTKQKLFNSPKVFGI